MPNNDSVKARAQSQFKKAEGQATRADKEKSARDATVVARDANTQRLKGLRLERDQAERDAIAANPPPAKKPRSRKPLAKAAEKPMSWGDLNIALNALVKEGIIVAYKAARAESGAGPAIEVTTTVGADQAEVISRVRQSLPEAFSEASVRTRTA